MSRPPFVNKLGVRLKRSEILDMITALDNQYKADKTRLKRYLTEYYSTPQTPRSNRPLNRIAHHARTFEKPYTVKDLMDYVSRVDPQLYFSTKRDVFAYAMRILRQKGLAKLIRPGNNGLAKVIQNL